MKKCPYCAEEIQDDAIKCRYCGSNLKAKRLFRSSTEVKLLGICGGLAEYFNIDSTIMRLIFALLIVWSGFFPGIIVYFILGLIIPRAQ